jgi:hypothetical protein
MYRVAPAALGKAKKKKGSEKSQIRGWLVAGSHNLSKAAWGCAQRPPSNFELSVLLATRDPAIAASWLDRLPMKLPPGGLTGLEVKAEPARPYEEFDSFEHPNAPFTFGRCDEEKRAAVAKKLGF